MVILNGNQAREYNRAQALALCFNEETKTYSLYPPFDAEAQLLFLNNRKLQSLVPAKNSNGIVITEDKSDLKITISLSANIICTHTADMLSALTNNATIFNNSIGKADFANSKKSYVSNAINDVLKAIRDNIVQFNLLLNFFTEKYPEFVKAYRKAIAIDYSGIRHSGIAGIITNPATGQPVQGVTITGEGKKKIAVSNRDGVYKLARLKIGGMKITITAPGYDTQVTDVNILRGKIIGLNIALQAQIIRMATA